MDYERLVEKVIKPYLKGNDTISYEEFDWEKVDYVYDYRR